MTKEMRLRLHGKTVAILTTEATVWYVYHEDIPDKVLDEKYMYLQFSTPPEEYNVMVISGNQV